MKGQISLDELLEPKEKKYRVSGRYNDMTHLVDTSIHVELDRDGIERVRGKPNDLVGFWISNGLIGNYKLTNTAL